MFLQKMQNFQKVIYVVLVVSFFASLGFNIQFYSENVILKQIITQRSSFIKNDEYLQKIIDEIKEYKKTKALPKDNDAKAKEFVESIGKSFDENKSK